MNIQPNEILFLEYLDGLSYTQNLPDYWKFTYGIEPNKTSEKLLNAGLIEYKINIEKTLKKLTIPQLKDILRENNLELTGKKQDLIFRILGNIDIDTLEKKFPEKIFSLTDSGIQLINNNYLFILNKKNNYGFTNLQIANIYAKYPNEKNENLVKLILIDSIKTLPTEKKWSDYEMRISQLAKYYFQLDEYIEALQYYIISFKLKLFNFYNDNYLGNLSGIFFHYTFIKELKSIVSITKDFDFDIYNYMQNETFTTKIPFKYFDNSECYKIFCDLINDKQFVVTNYNFNRPNPNSTIYKYYSMDDNKIFYNNSNKNNNKKSFISTLLDLFK
ncbi:SAP domain-containing protein [bacterium]|nr:SAP domain-containing protein [bacterium]